MTEDEVRDRAKIILKFDEHDKDALQGVGQITTFNQLGIKGEGKDKKPDGWYLPKNKNDVAIILETKNSGENLGKKATLEEIKRNCQIVMDAGFQYVVGILYNGEKSAGFINNLELDIPKELQEKDFYFKLVTDKSINRHMIYLLTAKINNCLHTEFGITDLYHRMIFTAGALVAERYGAKLSGMKDRGYNSFHTAIMDTLENALQKDIEKNQKIKLLIDVYSNIQMNTTKNQEAINNFINWVIEISRSINSNRWHGEDVMGIFFNEFNRYKKKSSAGQIFTPDHITSFMYRLINVTKDDYVGDFACGSGAFLVKAMSNMIEEAGVGTKEAREICQNHLFGIEFHREIYALACANMLIHKDGKTNLEQLDTRQQEACDWIKSKPITKVLMNPPFETKYGCVEIVKNVLDNVKKDTECAFIMPDKKLEKSSKKLVEGILEKHRLTTIVKLPEDLFFGVGVTASVFVFKAGNPQKDKDIFGVYIENDGLQTVKNQGRHDVKNLWREIEDYWIDAIEKRKDEKYKTHQWINPNEHLSYQMPEKPFEIYEEDFFKTALDYEMYKRGIDANALGEELLKKVLYASEIREDGDDILIRIKGGKKKLIDVGNFIRFPLYHKYLFDIDSGTKLDKSKMKENFPTINFVGRSNANNGVTACVDEIDDISPYEEGLLTLSLGGYVGSCFIQDRPFYTSQNVIVLSPKNNISYFCKQYIASVIFKESQIRYKAFVDELNRHIKTDFTIPLPIDDDKNPDYAFMENYIKTVDERAKKNLPLLTKAQQSLPKKIDVTYWKEFKIGELFNKCELKCLKSTFNKASDVSLIKTEEFNLPLVNAKHFNNGIMYYGREEDWQAEEMTVDIVSNGAISTGDVYAQPQKTGVLWDAYLVKLNDNVAAETLKYLATVIQSCVKKHFGYDNKCTWNKVKQETVSLPVTAEGKPDYDYMEKFMRNIEEKAALAANALKITEK